MELTLGLRTYLFLARRAEPLVRRRLKMLSPKSGEGRRVEERLGKSDIPRPEGTLIWINVAVGSPLSPYLTLADRLILEHGDACVLITTDTVDLDGEVLPEGVLHQLRPFDTGPGVQRFLEHWNPDLVVLTGDALWPMTVCLCTDKSIPIIGTEVSGRLTPKHRLSRSSHAALLSGLLLIAPASQMDSDKLRLLGVPAHRVGAIGALEQGGVPLPHNENERTQLAELLAVRPVWMAAPVQTTEVDAIAIAHRRASRLSHRLLLIVVPEHVEDGPYLRDKMVQSGWQVGLRSEGDEPEKAVQVYVADTEGELGLWYRLAPITYMGRSMLPPGGGHNPFEPAALGSAVLFGPNVGHHKSRYDRLMSAGAGRQVATGSELGAAVAELLAPDKAALMANAAWQVTSEGAEVTDQTLQMIFDVLGMDRVG